MDVEMLSRIQFAFTAAIHYFYPPLGIGLGIVLVMMEGMSLYIIRGKVKIGKDSY